METSSYDISAMKKYFFHSVYRKLTTSMTQEQYENYTSKPYFLLSEKIGGILMWALGTIFLILFIIFTVKDWALSAGSSGLIDFILPILFIIIGFISFFIFGYKMYFRARSLESLNTYFEKKQECLEAIDSLKQAIIADQNDIGIDPMNIDNIRGIMKNIEYLTKFLLSPLLRFEKVSKDLDPNQKEVMKKVLQIEFDWMVEYIHTFKELVKNWLDIHNNELKKVEETLREKNTNELSSALTRLELQSNTLEKVKVSL